MINISDKTKCCGCNACGDICPKSAIEFKRDVEGFWYPEVNITTCINCHLCESVCPNINKPKMSDTPLRTLAAINKNMKIRWDSTSGGLFSVFAEEIYNQGGFVGGAIYDKNFYVKHYISNKKNDLDKIRSSKYVQSNAEHLYTQIKKLLIAGEKVLICGTPCQMAALKNYLRVDYDNLITIDFICRGINSPSVYRGYLDSLEKKFNSKIIYIKAKNKELGWRSLTRKVVFENGDCYYGYHMNDDFRRGYHTNVFCRPSCYACSYKGFSRPSDITLADCWNIDKIDQNLDNDAGTSMIFINTTKGLDLFNKVKNHVEYRSFAAELLYGSNDALFKAINAPTIPRDSFFLDFNKYGFDYVVNKYFPYNTNRSYKERIKTSLSNTLKIFRYFRTSLNSYFSFYKINNRNKTFRGSAKNKFYPMPGSVLNVHKTASIVLNQSINFGTNAHVKFIQKSYLNMGPNTTLIINDGPLTRYPTGAYSLRSGAYIEIIRGGKLTIGQGGCNHGLTIMCAKEITIGNGVRIGRNVSIRDWNGPHIIVNETYSNHGSVHIGNHVWLASGCTILPGVTIGDGCVIASNSVVTKSFPANCLIAGSPAKIIKTNIEWY